MTAIGIDTAYQIQGLSMNTLAELASQRPSKDEYAEFYETYVSKVPSGNVIETLAKQLAELRGFYAGLSEEQGDRVHAPYTWSIKQVTGHLIDAERIFADRLHRFAMGETQSQPGMDQDAYIAGADYDRVRLADLADELLHCRLANLLLVQRIRPSAWDLRGVASGNSVTVRALAWILAGHIEHHFRILRQRLG